MESEMLVYLVPLSAGAFFAYWIDFVFYSESDKFHRSKKVTPGLGAKSQGP